MDICFVDESGSADTLCKIHEASTPAFVLVGLIVPGEKLRDLNWQFLQLKKKYNPTLAESYLSELIKTEVKGADLRADIRSDNRRRRRRAYSMLNQTLRLLEQHDCRVVGRVIVKAPDVEMDDSTMYSAASSWLCRAFHRYLEETQHDGIVLLDSRTKVKNTPSSLRIATQMFRTGGDPIPRLAEVPVFGHSDSHMTLQIADILASAIVFPCACAAYAMDHTWNLHAHNAYPGIRQQFGERLKNLQFRYHEPNVGQWRGGIYATGAVSGIASARLFRDPAGGTGQLPFDD